MRSSKAACRRSRWIVSSIANPFYPEFALAAEQAVRKCGYFLVVCNTNDNSAQESAYLDAVGGSLAHGVVVMHADFVQFDDLLALRQRVPVVLCMWRSRTGRRSCLASRSTSTSRRDRRRAPAQAGAPAHRRDRRQRAEWQTTSGAIVDSPTRCCAAHRPPRRSGALRSRHDRRRAQCAHALLAAIPELTAIRVERPAGHRPCRRPRTSGLHVPSQLSVIGITDIQLAHQVRLALTTVAVPTQEAAELAVQMIMDYDPRRRRRGGREHARDLVPRLVVRASTGRPLTSPAAGG